ncbi:hemolysin activation/secretion protein [Nicoletella semolina]|uniref:Hemolysin activation/secretion protein n=1 Tax=Nicoletella semolina TaxID=271160 RepID=A0A4R2N9D0_9PAST|nr:ShlB/FhaC/HecB family hemolysin secretion/activation protein [Nicoletella semolina]MDH2925528.1 hypothetical protein [Nicoletella semolina]TCP17603.1 hemolysin activation/secretion protein [Nicoletella semolina]
MKNCYNRTTLALLTLIGTSPLVAANTPNAGSLNKQIYPEHSLPKQKPSGELFPLQATRQYTNKQHTFSFKLTGIHLVSLDDQPLNDDISQITQHYLNKPVRLNDLEKLTHAITQYYRHQNYLIARAILPPQEIENGIVTIKLLKGELGKISINNQSALKDQFVTRLANTTVASRSFVYKDELEKFALQLNDIAGVKSDLKLRASPQAGKTDLQVNLQNHKRFSGYLAADNLGTSSTGRYRFHTGIKSHNFLGFGDELKLDALSSNTAGLKNIRLDYSQLIDGYGTRLGVNVSHLNYKLAGSFRPLDAKGKANTLGAYFSHPTIRTTDLRLNTKLAFNHQQLIDEQKAVNLKQTRHINMLNLGFNGAWNSVKNGVSYFGFNVVLGRENNKSNERKHNLAEDFKPNKKFSLVNYTFSHEQTLPQNLSFSLSANGQFSDTNLDSSQKLSLGGLSAVRGYATGAVSVDEGHIFQAELKHQLAVFSSSILSNSVFYDYAFGRYYKRPQVFEKLTTNNVTLQSAGIALSLNAPNNYALNVTWAKPLEKKFVTKDSNLFWLNAVKTF